MATEEIPEVYVLWHPAFPNGEALAQRIYRWVRPKGLGPQVFYRSLPAPEACGARQGSCRLGHAANC